MGWPRWLTFPKSRNSLDDILVEHMAKTLKSIGAQMVEESLRDIFSIASAPISRVKDQAKAQIFKVFRLDMVDADVRRVVAQAMDDVFDQFASEPLIRLRDRVVERVRKELKL